MDRPIISKADARASGLPHYFTGQPCKRGHLDVRMTSTGHCVSCNRERMAEWRCANRDVINEKARKWREANREWAREISRKWAAANPEKERERRRKRYLANPELTKAQSKDWYAKNKERARIYLREWRKANLEHARARSKAWRDANPDKVLQYRKNTLERHRETFNERARALRAKMDKAQKAKEYMKIKEWRSRNPELVLAQRQRYRQDKAKIARIGAERRARKRQAMPKWLSQEHRNEIRRIYRTAKAEGSTIDHIVPLDGCRVCGARGLHVPWNLQPLSFEDNSGKRNRCGDCWAQS